jgi:hypothetical protein
MAERDHVRAHTNPEVVNRLDDEARARVEASAAEGTISPRIAALRREWDIERYLEANASAFAGAGVLLAAVTANPRRAERVRRETGATVWRVSPDAPRSEPTAG